MIKAQLLFHAKQIARQHSSNGLVAHAVDEKPCPGDRRCSPAARTAKARSASMSSCSDADSRSRLRCPDVVVVVSVRRLALSALEPVSTLS